MIDLDVRKKIFDNKIIVLYILDSARKPLSLNNIVSLCSEFDDITYFDICIYIESLKKSGYINESLDEETALYSITEHGSATLKELLELIPGVNLYELKKLIEKNLTAVKTDYSIDTIIIPIKSDEYKVSCYIKDGYDELVSISIYAGNKEKARSISKNWNENSEAIYTSLLEMLTYDLKGSGPKNEETKTDYNIDANIILIKSDEYKVSCYIKDGSCELVNISIYAGNEEMAKNISKNWNENAETIYSVLLEMITKD